MASPEFAPLSAGISYRDPYYHIRRFNGDHYVFECVLQGTGYVEFNGTLTRLTAGDAYILHPCTFHHYYSDHNDPWVKIWFNGQGNLISHLLSDYQLGFNCCVRNFWKSDYLMQILQKLEKEPSLNKNELALLLHQHIIQFSEQLNGLQTDTSAPQIMKTYIEQNLTAPLNIADIAAQVHLSNSRAIHLFKETFHMTPYHYYLSRKLAIAQDLLRSTEMSIQEISDLLSFPDYRHFTNLFKRWTGVTPSWFRNDLSTRDDYVKPLPPYVNRRTPCHSITKSTCKHSDSGCSTTSSATSLSGAAPAVPNTFAAFDFKILSKVCFLPLINTCFTRSPKSS